MISNLSLLLVVSFTYILGIGVAHHLGSNLDLLNILLGWLVCILLVLMRNFLSAYYDHPDSLVTTLHKDDPLYPHLRNFKFKQLLQMALLVLTSGAMVTVFLVFRKAVTASGFLLLGIAFLICFFSATPPLRLEKKGYGEILEAILVVNLVPALALSLQEGELHILLVMLTLPLALIYLAMKIALSFEGYGYELTHGNRSISTRLGWQKAMGLHNLLVLSAFILVGAFSLVGLPWSFAWPMLLGLPVGVLQIYQIQQIAEGVKPRWRLLKWTAMGLFLLVTYLVIISLWIR